MGLRRITRNKVGGMLYDDFEPFSLLTTTLLSVYANAAASELLLNCASGGIYFRVEVDNDTLWWSDGPRGELAISISNCAPWAELIGANMDCAWMTMNQKGYIDGALLSFGDLLPCVAMNVRASAIRIAALNKWTAPHSV